MSDDPFEVLCNLDARAYESGFAEGTLHGKKEAIERGFKAGVNTAFKVAGELGYYRSLCQLVSDGHSNINPTPVTASPSHSDKLAKLSAHICELIDAFNLVDCHNEQFSIQLANIRDKFKQFCSLANIKHPLHKSQAGVSEHLTF